MRASSEAGGVAGHGLTNRLIRMHHCSNFSGPAAIVRGSLAEIRQGGPSGAVHLRYRFDPLRSATTMLTWRKGLVLRVLRIPGTGRINSAAGDRHVQLGA